MKTYSFLVPKDATWELTLLYADADYVNYIFLACHTIPLSTSAWMAWQAIEKYYKAFLLRYGQNVDLIDLGHDLAKCEREAKKLPEYVSFKLDPIETAWFAALLNPIDDTNEKARRRNPDIRYGGCVTRNSSFDSTFLRVGRKLRKTILTPEEYRKRGIDGIADCSLGGGVSKERRNYFRNTVIPKLLIG